jgi:hypothetical protein
MRRGIAGGGRHEIDVAAEQRGNGLGRALEHDALQLAGCPAHRLHQQAGGDVIVGAEADREPGRNILRISLHSFDQVTVVPDRGRGVHREHGVVVEERGNRREVAVVQRAEPGDVVGQKRRRADHEDVGIAGLLVDVVEGDVVAAAGRRADHDLDVALRRPALRGRREGSGRE